LELVDALFLMLNLATHLHQRFHLHLHDLLVSQHFVLYMLYFTHEIIAQRLPVGDLRRKFLLLTGEV